MIEGDGIATARCEGCGRLSLAILDQGEPVAFVCPPEDALIRLVATILEELNGLMGRPQ